MKKFTPEVIIAVVVAILMTLGLITWALHVSIRQSNGQTVTAECEVINMYYKTVRKNHAAYYFELLFLKDGTELEKKICFSDAALFNSVEPGDMILCEVKYDDAGIIDIEIIDPDLNSFSTAKHRTFSIITMSLLSAILLFTAVIYHFHSTKKKPSIEDEEEKG